ncbi:anti-sigma factor [Nocardia heshunensis]
MLRALADTVGLIADFGIGEMTDVRMALDEIATGLILDAVPGAIVDCRFAYDDRCMIVQISAVTRSEDALAQRNLCWPVVQDLTDTVHAVRLPFDGSCSGYRTAVELLCMRVAFDRG